MSFLTQWKSAKDTFESTTKDKKPSDKFWGLVRKGSDIEKALKGMNSAKTKKDLVAAVKEFDGAAKTYCERLTKEASNPSSVPKVDKKVYTDAINDLKKSLDDIKAEADTMATNMKDGDDKSKVDAKALQAAEHLMIPQRKLVAKHGAGMKILEKADPEAKRLRDGAEKAHKTATDPRNISDGTAKPAFDALMRFFDELSNLREKQAQPHYQAIGKEITAEMQGSAADLPEVKAAKPPLAPELLKEAKQLSATLTQYAKDAADIRKRISKNFNDVLAFKDDAKPVDYEAVQNSKDHIALRETMVTETEQWLKDSVKDLADVQKLETDVQKYLAAAEKFAKEKKKDDVNKLHQAAQKASATASRIAQKASDDEDKRTANGSQLMKARGDGGVGSNLPTKLAKEMKDKSNKIFAKFDTNQRAWLANVRKIGATGVAINVAADKIEVLAGAVPSADEFKKRLQPLVDKVTQFAATIGDRCVKCEGYVGRAGQTATDVENGTPTGPAMKTLTGMLDQVQKMVGNTEQAKNYTIMAVTRANGTASKDKEVVKLLTELKKKAKEVLTHCVKFDKVQPLAEQAYKDAIVRVQKVIDG